MIRRFFHATLAVFLGVALAFGFDTTPDPVSPDGVKAQIDLPVSQHMRNTGGSDGLGLCVPTSVTLGARWQNVPEMYGFRKFTESRPGGSYPEKLDADLKTYAARNKITLPAYVQHTGGDETFLDLCALTRRTPGVTYAGADGFYDSTVAHMVNLAHLDDKRAAIIDNNRSGNWVWMTRQQAVNRWKGLDDKGGALLVPVRNGLRVVWTPVGGGWAFVWLAPPPPPRPPSAAESEPAKPAKPADPFVWERRVIDERAHWFLYRSGSLAFVVDPGGKWHEAVGEDDWQPAPTDPPEGIPAPREAEPTADWNNGVAFWKVTPEHRYWISGCECSRAKAIARILDPGADGLSDDSDKYHLSVVGDRAVIAPLFSPGGKLERFARRLHVQVYSAQDWPAQDRLSSPVTLQEPAKAGGKVVGVSSRADEAALNKVLGDVFDPPVPVPQPKPPPPTPPEPAKPAPNPAPTPPDPAPAPSRPIPNWLKAVLALLAGLLGAHVLTKGK